MNKWIAPLVIVIFSGVGLWAAASALQIHNGKSDSGFCELGGNFSCDIVNQSSYAEVMGIPFALIGILGYAAMLVVVTTAVANKKKEWNELLFSTLCAMATIGLGIQIYLTIIEAFVLRAWCLLCLFSQVSILTVTITAWVWRAKELNVK